MNLPQNNNSMDLGKPLFDMEEPSPVMRFFFYFPLILLGVGSAYGFLYTAFAIKLSLPPLIWCGILLSVALPIFFLMNRFQALMLSISMVTWGGVLFIFRKEFLDGLILTVNAVIEGYSKKSSFGFATLPTEIIGMNQMIHASTVFAVFMLYPVIFLMSYFFIQRKRFFPIFALTLPFVAIPLAYTIIPNMKAAFGLLLFWVFLALFAPSLCIRSRIREKGNRIICHGTAVVNPGTFIAIFILAGFIAFIAYQVPSKGYVRSAKVDNLRENLVSMPQIEPLFRNDKIIGPGNVNLKELGNRRYTRKPVLRVKTANPDVVYLKGYVGSVYTGNRWESFPKRTSNQLKKILNGENVQNFPARFEELISQRDLSDLEKYTISIQNVNDVVRGIYIPVGLISTPDDLPAEISFVDDGYLSVQGLFDHVEEYQVDAFNHWSSDDSNWFLSERLETAEITTEEQKDFLKTAEAYGKFVKEEYTQLPSDVKKILDQYRLENNLILEDGMVSESEWTAGDIGWLQLNLALNIVTCLEKKNTYTLSPGKTPPGRDFLDYFLNENRIGYCVHFATAATALMRSAGIPARYVEGYVLEPTDEGREKDWRDILDSSAHAWVEFYMDGFGWIEIDATPRAASGAEEDTSNQNERLLQTEQSEEIEQEKPQEQEENQPIYTPKEDEEEQEEDSKEEDRKEEDPKMEEKPEEKKVPLQVEKVLANIVEVAIPFSVLVMGCVLLGIWGRRKYRLAEYQKLISQENQNKAALVIYQRLLDMEKGVGNIQGFSQQIPEDLHEIAMKARYSQHTLSQEEMAALFDCEAHFKEIAAEVLTKRQYLAWKYLYVLL